MPEQQDLLRSPQPWLRLLFWLASAAIMVFALRQLAPILFWILDLLAPFLVALVLAYVFNPIVGFVQRELRLGRIAGILVLGLAAVVVLTGMLVWLAPVLYQQLTTMLQQLRTAVPDLIQRFLANHVTEPTLRMWQERIQEILGQLDELARRGFAQMGGVLAPMAKGSLEAASNVAGGLFRVLSVLGGWIGMTALIAIVTFYYLAGMDRIPAVIRKLLPERGRERTWDLLVKADRAVGGFLRGQLIDCACVAALVSLVLFAIGLRQYAILIGCFAGAMNFIPYLGPVAGATPAILWALFSDAPADWQERGLTILFIVGGFALVQAIDGLILQPLIVGRHASLHPLLVIFALALGSQAGIGGMILAVPAACIGRVVWMELFWSKRTDFLAAGGRAEEVAK